MVSLWYGKVLKNAVIQERYYKNFYNNSPIGCMQTAPAEEKAGASLTGKRGECG